MRYGIISDIHSNLEALQPVIEALSKERIDKYICPGDIVGYGANPRECIETIRDLNPIIVCGNHEAGCTGLTGISYFNEEAKKAVIWTREILNEDELSYLGGLDLVREKGDFTVVHGTLQQPQDFFYMLDSQSAYGTFELLKTRICFIGHTHIPGIFIYDKDIYGKDKLDYVYKETVNLSAKKKYIVNAGSVGQPRDNDNRACYSIYDSENDIIQIKRLSYDIEKAQAKILKAGLPGMLAARLGAGR